MSQISNRELLEHNRQTKYTTSRAVVQDLERDRMQRHPQHRVIDVVAGATDKQSANLGALHATHVAKPVILPRYANQQTERESTTKVLIQRKQLTQESIQCNKPHPLYKLTLIVVMVCSTSKAGLSLLDYKSVSTTMTSLWS